MDAKKYLATLQSIRKSCLAHLNFENCDALGRHNQHLRAGDYAGAVNIAEEWAEEHKPTIFVADEMTNVYTFEVTYVDSVGATERTEEEKRLQMEHLEHLLKESGCFPNADDIKCVGMQQFMTKKHEEEKA